MTSRPTTTDDSAEASTGHPSAPAAAGGAPATPADGPGKIPVHRLTRRRAVGMGIWLAAFLTGLFNIGLPTDPVYAFCWLWSATIAWNSDRPWRSHLRFARDWMAVVVLLVVYNASRGQADDRVFPHFHEMIDADTWLFGWATGGKIPTVWLQEHLYRPYHIQWYDALVSIVYFTHFIGTLTVAVVLWLRSRPVWARFVRRWFTLTALGLATYFLYPAAPPWLAGGLGFLPDGQHVARISTRGWEVIGLHGAGNLLNAAQVDAANLVAAMPSLHSAFALLIVAFFLPMVRRRWWPLLLAYPLAMTFTLVYSGEHYVIDVLVGWAYVAVTFVAVGLAERAWAAYRRRRSSPGGRNGNPQAGDLAGRAAPDSERVGLAQEAAGGQEAG
jgi:membrane-associated phospholipid phosphatase